jgi:hypothetical protein
LLDAAVSEEHDPERLIGWKAIAGYLHVSPRTAVRWAERYGLPVERVPRGGRPLVHSTAGELRHWWESSAAGEARAEGVRELRPGKGDSNGSVPAEGLAAQPPGRPVWRSPWRAFSLLLTVAAVAGVYLWWAKSGASEAEASKPLKFIDRASGRAASPRLVELRLAAVGGQAFAVTVVEGEMARLETPTASLGLQAKVVDDHLKVFAYRFRPVGSGESAEYLESRVLPPDGAAERVRLEGVVLELMWPGEIPVGMAATQLERAPCCIVCSGMTMCGRTVSATCGGCQGKITETTTRGQ